jgi:hypothetical protein
MTEDLRAQYATDDNLQARIALHAAFSIDPHWCEWLFDREAPGRAPASSTSVAGWGPSGEPTASESTRPGRSHLPTSRRNDRGGTPRARRTRGLRRRGCAGTAIPGRLRSSGPLLPARRPSRSRSARTRSSTRVPARSRQPPRTRRLLQARLGITAPVDTGWLHGRIAFGEPSSLDEG